MYHFPSVHGHIETRSVRRRSQSPHESRSFLIRIIRLEKDGIHHNGTTDEDGFLIDRGTFGKGDIKGI